MYFADRYGDLFQVSYITRDMDAALHHADTELGITDFKTSEPEIDVLYYGQPRKLALRAAMADIGTQQFEIIQPVSGAIEIYTEAVDLSAHILNFHHVAVRVPGSHDDWLAALDDIRASGDEFAYLFPCEPAPEFGIAFCYVDTRRRLGHYTEYIWMDPALVGGAGSS